MIIACGTDDEISLTKQHFGDSNFFLIYELNEGGFNLVKKVKNESPEEEHHGDPKKAGFIAGVMKQNEVKVLVAYAMGPNIVRMRKKFLPVISRIENINEALNFLHKRFNEIQEKVKQEGDKEIIYLNKN